MVLSSTIQTTLQRHQQVIDDALHATFEQVKERAGSSLAPFYGQLQYHIGQVDANFAPTKNNSGKLLRPNLLLMAYEASGAWGLTNDLDYLERALPAAVALELTHNFTLIHDDIEDSDAERRHRPTVWKLWGVPQAINTGDGMFSLARLTLWDVLAKGVEGDIAARLGALLDFSCLILAEGQYLDISFEARQDISVAMYIDMISRKTAALMACAAEMGATLGTRDTEIITRLSSLERLSGSRSRCATTCWASGPQPLNWAKLLLVMSIDARKVSPYYMHLSTRMHTASKNYTLSISKRTL